MDDYIADFVADTRDGYDRIADDLARWSADPTDANARDAIFRFVHTVRGNAGFLRFERFERLSVPAEQAMALLPPRTCAERSGAIVAIVHRMGAIAAAIEAGTAISAHDEPALVSALGLAPARRQEDTAPPAMATAQRSHTVRMPAHQFDQLADCVDAVAASHRQLLDLIGAAPGASAFGPALADFSQSVSRLSRTLTLARLQPAGRIFAGLDQLVEQSARTLGKRATLETSGDEHLLDRELVEGLRDIILHLVRNAIDHGIESPEARRDAGKPADGTIRLIAEVVDGEFRLSVHDDGGGIPLDRLATAAAARGIVLACSAHDLDDAQLTGIVSTPGVTTAAPGSDFSGRGIGLDAVRAAAERLGGKLALANRPGQGLAVTIAIPAQDRAICAA